MRSFLIFVLFSLSTTTAAAIDLTGNWNGRYTVTWTDNCCTNLSTITSEGPLTASLQQAGASVTGDSIFNQFKGAVDEPDHICSVSNSCTLIEFGLPLGVAGSLSGLTLSGSLTLGDIGGQQAPMLFTGTVAADGNSFSGTLSFPPGDFAGLGGTGSLTMTRTNVTPVGIFGEWNGTYEFTDLCPVTSRGPMSISFAQTGAQVSGTATFGNAQSTNINCVITGTETFNVSFDGSVFGTTLTIPAADDGDGNLLPISGTVVGSTLAGTISSFEGSTGKHGGIGTFSVFKVNGPATVLSFTAIPATVRQGAPVTLLWSTANASGVTISGGVGAGGVSGATTVTPSSTTTYALSATGSGGNDSANATVTVVTDPAVGVGTIPRALLQTASAGGAATTFTLTNAGGASTTVSLSKSGSFFSLDNSSLSFAPGESKSVTITGTLQPAGSYDGLVALSGNGVPPGLSVPVHLLSVSSAATNARLDPASNRVDVSAPAGSSPSGFARFTNNGTSAVDAIASSDVPWIIPETGGLTVASGASRDVSFSIDRALRPDGSAPNGSAGGTLLLSTLSVPGAKRPLDATSTSTSLAGIIDTVRPGTAPTTLPPLLAGELALLISGVGHVQGSVGLFVSDLSILNTAGGQPITDLRLYYSPASGASAQTSTPGSLASSQALNLADVVKSTFSGDGEVGTLQIRSSEIHKLAVAASVFNSSNPKGTYGTAIPVFPSDHSVKPGSHLMLAGLLRDANSHTNLYLQETSGSKAGVTTEFLNAEGEVIGSRDDALLAFGLKSMSDVVPEGAVSARVTNQAASLGRVVAFATPVDELSGDTWVVVGWQQQFGYSPSDALIVPVAGAVRGANQTYFRTDVAMINNGTIVAKGTLRYYERNGQTLDRMIELQPNATSVIRDIVTTLFGVTTDTVGYLVYTPAAGGLEITSRTYTTVAGSSATFGTAVPTVSAESILHLGDVRRIGSLDDASFATISAGRPATFRTNIGLVEAIGAAATVRVTLYYPLPAGGLAQGRSSASKDYVLAAHQFLLVNNVAHDILGESRETNLGDLRDIQLDFQVVGGDGGAVVFTSSVDNGTGDSILRIE